MLHSTLHSNFQQIKHRGDNMVLTTSLLNQVRDDIQDDIETNFTHGAVGNDNTTPTASDTELGNEQFRDAVDDVDKSVDNKITVTIQITPTENNGNTIRETGWFNAASTGTMWTRDTLTDLNKTSDISVYIDTTITITVTEG